VSEVAQRESETFVVPLTQEVIDLGKTPEVARALISIRQAFGVLSEARHILESMLIEEARRHGAKSFDIEDMHVELRDGSKLVWDIETLEELRDAGLPEERWDDLVQARVEYHVSARVAAQLERSGNEEYAKIIDRARSREEGPTRVSVTQKPQRRG